MKSRTIFTKRCGWSLCGKCPALGTISTRAVGASALAKLAWLTGMIWSSAPQMTHIGIASVR